MDQDKGRMPDTLRCLFAGCCIGAFVGSVFGSQFGPNIVIIFAAGLGFFLFLLGGGRNGQN